MRLAVVEPLEVRCLCSAAPIAHAALSAIRAPAREADVPDVAHMARHTRTRELLAALNAVKQRFHIPGVVVGIASPSATWETALGYSDIAGKTPLSTSETFPIRSITKSFTVTLILQLARAHELSLKDPIGKYVSGIPNGSRITVAELAGMTSGIKDYTAVDAFLKQFVGDLQRQWTPQELVDFGISESPVFSPGEQYDYSNTNTILLGMVASQVTHLPLKEAFKQYIFTPLGLSQTHYLTSLAFPQPHPIGYEVDPGTGSTEAQPSVSFSAFDASGAMVSTIGDLLKWGPVLGTGTLIGRKLQSRRESDSRRATDGPEYDRYGLGIGKLNGWWGHTGEGLGFQAAVFYNVRTKTTIAVLVNSTQPTNVATEMFKALSSVMDRRTRRPVRTREDEHRSRSTATCGTSDITSGHFGGGLFRASNPAALSPPAGGAGSSLFGSCPTHRGGRHGGAADGADVLARHLAL